MFEDTDLRKYRVVDFRTPEEGELFLALYSPAGTVLRADGPQYARLPSSKRYIVEPIRVPAAAFESATDQVYEPPQATITVNVDLNTDAALERAEALVDALRR